MPILPMESSKITADGRGVEVKNLEEIADVLNGWSLTLCFLLDCFFVFFRWLDKYLTALIRKLLFSDYSEYSLNHSCFTQIWMLS